MPTPSSQCIFTTFKEIIQFGRVGIKFLVIVVIVGFGHINQIKTNIEMTKEKEKNMVDD